MQRRYGGVWVKGWVCLFIACLLISGCNSLSKPGSKEKVLSEHQVLRMIETASVSTLDSVLATDMPSFNILSNVQEGLMRMGKEKNPDFAIAESVKVSPDKKTYTFKLREDVTWSDGKKCTAYDFVYAWRRVLNPNLKAGYANMLYAIENAQEYHQGKVTWDKVGIRATDDVTLVVKLKTPVLDFLSMTTLPAFYPQRADIVQQYKGKYGTGSDKLVYNGPFVVSRWDQGKIILEKNSRYHDQNAVALKKIEISIVKDTVFGVGLYNSNRVDIAPLDQSLVEAYRHTPDYVEMELASTSYILFNHQNPFFQNPNIRRAISLAIDREELTQHILKDGSKPAGSLVPPSLYGVGMKSFREKGEIMQSDPAEAKQLFQEGLKELKLDHPPTRITMILDDSTSKRDIAVAIQKRLRYILGLSIKLDAQPWKSYLEHAQKRDFDMGLLGWLADYNDPSSFYQIFQTANPMNFSNYQNSRYDNLVNKANKEIDPKRQHALYLQAEQILAGTGEKEDAAFAPLYYGARAFVQRQYVKDLLRHPYGPQYTLKWAYITRTKEG